MEIMNFQSSVQASPHGELMILAVVLDPFSNMSAFNPKSIRWTEIINWCSEYYKKWFSHEQRCPVVCNGNAVVAVVAVVAVIITATTGNGSFAQRQRNGTATPNNGMPL